MGETDYGDDVKYLKHMLRVRDRQAKMTQEFWVRAAKAALAGDPRELRNRVDLIESGPVNIVLSAAPENHITTTRGEP